MRIYCGDIKKSHLAKEITVCGWVLRVRDHGGVLFIDCRDISGVLQIVCNPEQESSFVLAQQLRDEFVITVTGKVQERPAGTINDNISTGQYELIATELNIINKSATLPFSLSDFIPVGENIRFKYRYLDLRRPEVADRIVFRAKGLALLRGYLEQHKFLDIETPILTKTTPEGARDYLVPSRVQNGNFYALPQSPQIFKQILMIAGFDRYFQVARCFRDEDLRADRQPEFSQLDIEMSFVSQQQVMDLAEGAISYLFQEMLAVDLGKFKVMSYQDAMMNYGSDKPDLRNPLFFVPCDDIFASCDFKVFAEPANNSGCRVAAMRLPAGCTKISRKDLSNYTDLVSNLGAKGLAYIKVNDISAKLEGMQSPILKFLNWEIISTLLERTAAVDGDMIFFAAGSNDLVNKTFDALRNTICQNLNLYQGTWEVLWVTDFPMFEEQRDDNGFLNPLHHQFTAPRVKNTADFAMNADNCLSQAYDLVINGYEIGGGSIRIDDLALQLSVLEHIGIAEEEAQQKFGHLLEALKYGCPPHGGIAFGIDRLFMLMTGAESIRDVIAFPKTQSAACLLTNAPSTPETKQLLELGLRVRDVMSDSTKNKG